MGKFNIGLAYVKHSLYLQNLICGTAIHPNIANTLVKLLF